MSIFRCSCTDNDVNASVCSSVQNKNVTFTGLSEEQKTFLNDTDIWSKNRVVGEIVIPDDKPLMKRINVINTSFKLLNSRIIETPAYYTTENNVVEIQEVKNFENKVTTGRKLVVEGILTFDVNYAADTPDGTISYFDDSIPFSAFMVLPSDAELTDNYAVKYLINDVGIKQICDRNLSLSALVTLKATKIKTSENEQGLTDEVVTNVNNNIISTSNKCTNNLNYANRNSLNATVNNYDDICTPQVEIAGVATDDEIVNLLDSPATSEWTEISVYSEVPIEVPYKDLCQVLNIDSKIDILCQQVVKTAEPAANIPAPVTNAENMSLTGYKLIIQGVLDEVITYIGDSEYNSIHSMSISVPFTAYIILDNSKGNVSLDSVYNITSIVEDIFIDKFKERKVFQNTTLFIKAEKIS